MIRKEVNHWDQESENENFKCGLAPDHVCSKLLKNYIYLHIDCTGTDW